MWCCWPARRCSGSPRRSATRANASACGRSILARQPALRTALEPGAAGPVGLAPDPPDGFILRTAAQDVSDERLADDVGFVQHLWASIRERLARAEAPVVVYEDLPLVLRTLRSVVADEVERIRID